MHGRHIVCSPQIPRRRFSFALYLLEENDDDTPSVFTEEHLRSSELGENSPDHIPLGRYRLTRRIKLGIEPLRDRALADIKNKVSQDNVVDEVFSWITAKWVLSHSLAVRSD